MMEGENGHGLRHELKYRISRMQHETLRRRLTSVLKTDPHTGPDGRYVIRTLYFDDYTNTALIEKRSGVSIRNKYRLRIYNHDDSLIKFERKARVGDLNRKESVRLTRDEAERILSGDVSFLADSRIGFIRDFYRLCRCRLMRPVITVEYTRTAYIYPVGNVRVTFDTDLRSGLGPTSFFSGDAPMMRLVGQPDAVLEIKYDDVLPTFIRGIFPDNILPRTGNSKFALCRGQDVARTGSMANTCTVIA